MSENPDHQLDSLGISGERQFSEEASHLDSPGLGGDMGLGVLLESIKSPDAFKREYSAKALAHVVSDQVVDVLTEVLHSDPDRKVRMTAASSLGVIGTVPAIHSLIEVMLNSDEMLVRLAAAEGLKGVTGSLHDPALRGRVIQAMIEGLRDASNFVRLMVCRAMGSIVVDYPEDSGLMIPALTQSLTQDIDDSIRKESAWTLGKVRDERAVPHLIRALRDTGEIRRLVAGALGQLSPYISDEKLRQGAISGLIEILGDPYKPDNVQISVMGTAAYALGEFGDAQAVPALLTALESDSGELRLLSVRALQKVVDLRSESSLIACLDDIFQPPWANERVCDAAAVALESLGTPSALEALAQWRGTSH